MNRALNSIWLKAAVAGGLWASFEIIVGSMLHNLHLPFSGTILASFSVALMIAFMQIWKTNGMIWRAGIICGLMKSLSPSAVILGPMTGIMMEAVFMDLMIFLVGRNLVAYLLAGTSALLSTILHKLASLFILYGTDLVTIYSNLFEFLKKQLSLENATPEGLITGFIAIYFLLGIAASLSGYFLGRYAARSQGDLRDLKQQTDPFRDAWTNTDPGQAFRTALFFLHLLMIPAMLLLINRYGLGATSLVPSGIYLGFLLLYYKRILGRLLKPFFWSQLLIMTLVAGIFWDPPGADSFRVGHGFQVGLEMSLRAILIVAAFSALSVEIRNPRITGSLLRMGFGNAYAAVSLSFNSLPVMIDRSADLKTFIRNPVRSLTKLIFEAELWLKCYQTHLRE
ncbi:MAG: hypothetical protein V2B15_04930 [Bacteroidota bacterium]